MTPSPAPIAKTSVPRLFGVVARERLFTRLDEHRGRPLLWIAGPPGAGKTTLVASYVESRNIPTLWYQVDVGDADAASLFHHLSLAASSLGAGETRLRLAPEHLPDLAGFVRLYFRALFASLPRDVVLVFDNCQEVADDGPLHRIVRCAASEVSGDRSIVCISRLPPPPDFSQLAATSAMITLRWDALRLTLDETRAIASTKTVLDDWLVRALHEQSEGWAAGITLMLERLATTSAGTSEFPTDSRESVFHYFATLLFDQAPPRTRHVLLSVALLPQIPVSAAVALSGDPGALQVLESLHRRQLFVDKRTGVEPVYQCHALLREFLIARLAETASADTLDSQRLRSAGALDAAGQIEAAFALRIEARDWAGSVATIERNANELLNSGRWQTLAMWVDALPEDVRTGHPITLYWQGMAWASVDPQRAMDVLRDALEHLDRRGDRRGRLLCLAGLLGVTNPGYAAVGVADQWIDGLLPELDSMRDMLSVQEQLQVWGGLCTQLLFARPWHERVTEAPHRIHELLPGVRDPRTRITAATGAIGALISMTVPFDLGEQIIAECEGLADRPDISPAEAAWFVFSVGYHRFIQARYEEAWRDMDRAWRIADRFGLRERLSELLLYRYMVEFRSVGWTTAEATWREYRTLPAPRRIVSRAVAAIMEARFRQSRGRFAEAATCAATCLALVRESGSPHLIAIYGLFVADSFVRAGSCRDAEAVLAISRNTIATSPAIEVWSAALTFTEAYLLHARGHPGDALERLAEALSLARSGNRKYFLRYQECAMPPMFALALGHGIEVDLVLELIALFRLPPPENAPDRWPRPVRIRTLGRFELLVNDAQPAFSRKLPKKTLALLKVLVAHGGREVGEQHLCDALWADEEADAARQALSITVLRLRKLLGANDSVQNLGGSIALDRRLCWVDAWRFEALLDRPTTDSLAQAISLYEGSFLPQDEGEAWSVAARERLRGKFVRAIVTHGRTLEAACEPEAAIHLYQRGVDADAIVEAFHQGLMRCYCAVGRPTEAIGVYRRLRQTLSVVLGVPPSAETEQLFRGTLEAMAQTPEAVTTIASDIDGSPRSAAARHAPSVRRRRSSAR